MANLFRLGLIINPLAGLGGSVGLKGSDGQAQKALALGAKPQAMQRVKTALTELLAQKDKFEILTVAGDMGHSVCKELGLQSQVIYTPPLWPSSASDTENAARLLAQQGVDILLFAGGDGTARNICAAVADNTTVLGIPAGVKIHSGVYAISPQAAGKLVAKLVAGELVSLSEAPVMDIDEQAFRTGVVKARRFGEMRIPALLRYVQSVKMGGRESEELVLADLAAYVVSQLE
ncbi:MAG: putative polyphosphate/ATP-dependent NAD kinase, partial [Rheinheimera aquimaris]